MTEVVNAFKEAIARHHRVDVWKTIHKSMVQRKLTSVEQSLYNALTRNLAYELNGWEESEEPPKP